MRLQFQTVDVFTGTQFVGNPLAVVLNAEGLSTGQMQAIAAEFNLSETTFIARSDRATARVRIFTPTFEMPFAGHPTLGTAHVVRAMAGAGDRVTLEMTAGIIPVEASGDVWTLTAGAPTVSAVSASRAELAAMLGLAEPDVAPDPAAPPLWVNTGSDQLIIPLASVDAVMRTKPRSDLMQIHASNGKRAMAYVFAHGCRAGTSAGVAAPVAARFFFPKYGAVVEDPGTGSDCANLGGWLIATGAKLPQRLAVAQGDEIARPCRLGLEVSADRQIRVSGRVIELGRGRIGL